MRQSTVLSVLHEIGKAVELNLLPGAMAIKKIETENITAYWVNPTTYRIDIKTDRE